jgi:hypothetical protein
LSATISIPTLTIKCLKVDSPIPPADLLGILKKAVNVDGRPVIAIALAGGTLTATVSLNPRSVKKTMEAIRASGPENVGARI